MPPAFRALAHGVGAAMIFAFVAGGIGVLLSPCKSSQRPLYATEEGTFTVTAEELEALVREALEGKVILSIDEYEELLRRAKETPPDEPTDWFSRPRGKKSSM